MDATRPLRIEGVVQHYAWGSPTAIAELLGREPSGEPEAELWLGAHPSAPAAVSVEGGAPVPLDAYIGGDPQAALGPGVVSRFGPQLPFLLKLLAAGRPLSIQAHPNAEQARAGFDRENRAGLALDAPERSYRDPRPKPELICALTRFRALNRFRRPEAIRERLAPLDAAELAPALAHLDASDSREALAGFYASLLSLPPASGRRLVAVARAHAAARRGDPEADWVERLATLYPEDPGVLAPWVLNYVELDPGQAMYLGAGELHAYLEGVGIECMQSSDNVLRGGLTRKHVDSKELLRVLSFEAGAPEVLSPRRVGGVELRYETPAEAFALSRLEIAAGTEFVSPGMRGPEILLVTQGRGSVLAGEAHLDLRAGSSVFLPASAPRYRIRGELVAHRATVGVL